MKDTTRDLVVGVAVAAVVFAGGTWLKARNRPARRVDHVTQLRLDADAAAALPAPEPGGDVTRLLDLLPSFDDLGLPTPTAPARPPAPAEVVVGLDPAPFTPTPTPATPRPSGPVPALPPSGLIEPAPLPAPEARVPRDAVAVTPTPDLAPTGPSSPPTVEAPPPLTPIAPVVIPPPVAPDVSVAPVIEPIVVKKKSGPPREPAKKNPKAKK